MARFITKTSTENKKDGPTKIITREAEITEELADGATKETTTLNLNGKHSPYDPCNLSNPSNSLNNVRMETETEAKEVKENGEDPEGEETSTPIVTRAEGTEDTETAGSDGIPKEIPPCPRSVRSQTTAQPLAK